MNRLIRWGIFIKGGPNHDTRCFYLTIGRLNIEIWIEGR